MSCLGSLAGIAIVSWPRPSQTLINQLLPQKSFRGASFEEEKIPRQAKVVAVENEENMQKYSIILIHYHHHHQSSTIVCGD
jgi:hypothetical protein